MTGRLQRVGQVVALVGVAALLGLLIWKVVVGDQGGAANKLAKGEVVAAPDFTLERLDGPGGTVSLSELRGKPLVVNFWASWCIPCKDEAPTLQQTSERYRKQGLVVVGIDAQDFRKDARRFMARYGITYPVAYDGKGSTLGRWGVTGFPETFFVDRSGKLVGPHISGPVDGERNRAAFAEGIALVLGDGQ